MSFFQRLAGVVNSFFQIGGPSGPGLNNNSGVIEARNAANNAFAIVRGAAPVGDSDLTTKQYVDTIFKPIVVSVQSNAASALIPNSGTEKWYVVTGAGTGAAAAYTLGTILWDDGSGAGNVTVLPAVAGNQIVTTASFTGGTITLSANQNYVWTGTTWQNNSPSVAGAVFTIDMATGTGASQSSVTSIPANAVIVGCEFKVTTPYSAGATVAVGQTGTTNLLMAAGDSVATVANEYGAPQRTAWGASPLPVLVTVTGAPAAGVGTVTVQYTAPLS